MGIFQQLPTIWFVRLPLSQCEVVGFRFHAASPHFVLCRFSGWGHLIHRFQFDGHFFSPAEHRLRFPPFVELDSVYLMLAGSDDKR